MSSIRRPVWRLLGIIGSVLSPPLQVLSVDDVATPDPQAQQEDDLVDLKNSERMAALRPRMRAFSEVTFDAAPIARVMRRDWNILSINLYKNSRDEREHKKIYSDLVELSWQVDDTADQVRAMPFAHLDRQWLRPRRMQVQIVHPIAAGLLRSMMTLDEVYRLLICAERVQMISRKKRHSLLLPCQLSYMTFKATAMRIAFRSTDELLRDTRPPEHE